MELFGLWHTSIGIAKLSKQKIEEVKTNVQSETYFLEFIKSLFSQDLQGLERLSKASINKITMQDFDSEFLKKRTGDFTCIIALEPTQSSYKLMLHDARTLSNGFYIPSQPFGRSFNIDLISGSLILFPSWVQTTICPSREAVLTYIEIIFS